MYQFALGSRSDEREEVRELAEKVLHLITSAKLSGGFGFEVSAFTLIEIKLMLHRMLGKSWISLSALFNYSLRWNPLPPTKENIEKRLELIGKEREELTKRMEEENEEGKDGEKEEKEEGGEGKRKTRKEKLAELLATKESEKGILERRVKELEEEIERLKEESESKGQSGSNEEWEKEKQKLLEELENAKAETAAARDELEVTNSMFEKLEHETRNSSKKKQEDDEDEEWGSEKDIKASQKQQGEKKAAGMSGLSPKQQDLLIKHIYLTTTDTQDSMKMLINDMLNMSAFGDDKKPVDKNFLQELFRSFDLAVHAHNNSLESTFTRLSSVTLFYGLLARCSSSNCLLAPSTFDLQASKSFSNFSIFFLCSFSPR